MSVIQTDLHGVFAVTIYGDKIRVTHYQGWHSAQNQWNAIDWGVRASLMPLIKFVCVRSWDDPEWNTARYRPLVTVIREGVTHAAQAEA